jgi:membrane protease YdiL (CAAX protease family)
MWVILPYLAPLSVTVAANLGVTHRRWRRITYLSLAVLNALAAAGGLFLMAAPSLLRSRQQAGLSTVINTAPLGVAFVVAALLGFLFLLPAVRRLLASTLSIDPASPVHTTALVFALYLAASSLSLLLLPPSAMLDTLESASIDTRTLVYGQAVMLLFALAGVGLGTRRSLSQVMSRLGLRLPSLRNLSLAAALMVGFLALDYAVSVIWQRLWPLSYQMVSESSQRLYAPFGSIPGALLLGLSAGIGEESLFRGALQPRLRILLTAVVFTLGHVQYALSPALAEILVIGLVLGWLRERTNTTTCMVTHAGYNFLDSVLARFFP